jgi:hypothetical protein
LDFQTTFSYDRSHSAGPGEMSIPFLLGCSAIGAPEVIVCTGGNCTATSGGDDNIPIVLFANLPVTPRPGDVRFVSNTNGAGCNGSGATMLECMWNGSAWVPTGTGSITTTGGDVFGPASSGNGKSAVFSGTSGKLLAQSTLTGLIKEDAGLPSVAIPATDYLTPTGSDAGLTSSPTLNLKNARRMTFFDRFPRRSKGLSFANSEISRQP